jgi:hypothetical protein
VSSGLGRERFRAMMGLPPGLPHYTESRPQTPDRY